MLKMNNVFTREEVTIQEKENQIEYAINALNDKVEKLSDVEELLDEMADISYKKACEKVAQVATAKHYPIKHNQNIPNEEGRKVRGFDGVHVMIRTNRFI